MNRLLLLSYCMIGCMHTCIYVLMGYQQQAITDSRNGFPVEGEDSDKRLKGMMPIESLSEQLEEILNIQRHNGVLNTVNFKYQKKQAFTGPVAFKEEITDYA